jgi:hypothetical protein
MGGDQSKPSAAKDAPPVTQPHDVDKYNVLQKRSAVGDKLDLHHFPQSKPAKEAIHGFEHKSGVAMAMHEAEHKNLHKKGKTFRAGQFQGNPRDLLAQNARDVRNYTSVPNASIREAIDANKKTHPTAFKKDVPEWKKQQQRWANLDLGSDDEGGDEGGGSSSFQPPARLLNQSKTLIKGQGNRFEQLKQLNPDVANILRNGSSTKARGSIKSGSYLVHTEYAKELNRDVSLSVRVEFSHSTTSTSTSGNTTTTTTTNYYNAITEWG